MKQRDANRHPGPWRVMRVDSEFAGLLVAVGFVVMGLVSMPNCDLVPARGPFARRRGGTAAALYQEGMRLTHSRLHKGSADTQ
jgi:hypothetical protein